MPARSSKEHAKRYRKPNHEFTSVILSQGKE
jgi:hypothetical protein